MPPDLIRLLEALAVAAFLVVLLPKRSWRSLAPRFSDLLSGRRASLFEPPHRRKAMLPSQLFAELPRIFELGVPSFVAARIAERSAMSLREAEQAAWRTSSSAVLLDLIQRGIDEEEAQRRLETLGLPQPQPKAETTLRTPRLAMPLDWFVGAEPEAVTAQGNGSQIEYPASDAERRKHGLEVRTLGALILRDAAEDLTPVLLRSRVYSFIWLHLLMRAIATPRTRVSRGEMADELTPGLNPDKQRKRLRNRLSDLLAELPPPLKAPITLEEDFLRFDLDACSVDLVTLLELARECAGREGLLSEALAAEVEAALVAAEGEFLPGWDAIEREVTGGRGTSGDLVRDIRGRAEDARVTLLAALAQNRIARRDAGRAIPLLEQALERRPDREDLALNLRAAYLETGQIGRAAALQREYGLESKL
jgi:DNA-binding SARP family transcriptional activator